MNNQHQPWPPNWPAFYNACNEPCDMREGPCACGGWHHAGDWSFKAWFEGHELRSELVYCPVALRN